MTRIVILIIAVCLGLGLAKMWRAVHWPCESGAGAVCPRCRTSNPATAKYCATCGALFEQCVGRDAGDNMEGDW